MGEIAINPIHNVHKKYREMNLVNPYIFTPPTAYNTYIGAFGQDYTTSNDLAARLGISASRITDFVLTGFDIKCKISGTYEIPAHFASFKHCTYYYDNDNLVTRLKQYAFDQCVGGFADFKFNGVNYVEQRVFQYATLTTISLPACVTVNSTAFIFCDKITLVDLPLITSLGGTTGMDNVFLYTGSFSKTLKVPAYFQTNNAGAPDGDVTNFISQNGSVIYL